MDATVDQISFDDDQRVRILHIDQRTNAEALISSANDYREAFDSFNQISSTVISQIESIAAETESKRKLALSMHMNLSGSGARIEHATAVARAKISLKMVELEQAKLEQAALETFVATQKQTRTILVEIFGN